MNAAFACVAHPIGTYNSEPDLDSRMLALSSLSDASASSTEWSRKKHKPPLENSARQPKSGGSFHHSCVKNRYPSPMLATAMTATMSPRSSREEG